MAYNSKPFVISYCCLFFFFFFSLFIFFVPLHSSSYEDHEVVPAAALYIFGDSTVDAGNNNHLVNTTKANQLPFGIDFNTSNTPTGRFTNGKTFADFLAMKLGLPLVAAYLDLSENQRKQTRTGINYASGGCGILPTTNYKWKCLSLDMQIDLFAKTVSEDLPNNTIQTPQELQSHLSRSIFLISSGTNDYGLNYLDRGNPKSLGKSLTQEEFAKKLLEELSSRLKRLVGLGAKKFLINNLGPLGCIPLYTYDTGNCVYPINKMVKLYADGLPKMLAQLQEDLKNSTFSFSDNFSFFKEMEANGVLDTKHKCAVNSTTVCENRDKFFFFDGIHTSQVANSQFIDACFHNSLCTPNIEQLIRD